MIKEIETRHFMQKQDPGPSKICIMKRGTDLCTFLRGSWIFRKVLRYPTKIQGLRSFSKTTYK